MGINVKHYYEYAEIFLRHQIGFLCPIYRPKAQLSSNLESAAH